MFLGIVLIGLVAMMYSVYEYYHPRVKRLTLSNYTRYHDVPKEFKGKRVLFVSDLQFDHPITGFDHFAMRRLTAKIKKLKPDLLILCGDLIHGDNDVNHYVFEYLSLLSMEKWMILGNHDYKDIGKVYRLAYESNIQILKNKSIVWSGIHWYGVDDYRCGMPDIELLEDEQYNILLSHNPDYAEKIQDKKIDLVLSGHFHAGQITLFGLWAPAITSENGQLFRYGHVAREDKDFYVSSGIGGQVFGLPLRFCARPEIVVIEY